jgi:curli production assembly/transport component CsgG/holdfast attachment protein HfaB
MIRAPRRILLSALLLLTLGACAAGPSGNYVEPLGGALVIDTKTPYSGALACLREALTRRGVPGRTYAVGEVADYTGKDDYYDGRVVTQGAALMVISALGRLGVPQVERFDTGVIELELKYANNKLIGTRGEEGHRKILSGSITGSEYYIVGGITEVNFNIHSSSADLLFGPASVSGRFYVLDVALDLRVVATGSSEVVATVAYQKQVKGREIRAGLFEFIGGEPLDVGVGERSQEPIQRAVRAIVERATIDLIARAEGIDPANCLARETAAAPLRGAEEGVGTRGATRRNQSGEIALNTRRE